MFYDDRIHSHNVTFIHVLSFLKSRFEQKPAMAAICVPVNFMQIIYEQLIAGEGGDKMLTRMIIPMIIK